MTHWLLHRTLHAAARILVAGALLAGSLGATADTNALASTRKLSAVAQIVFRGTSTLHDFEGRVMSQPFPLLMASNSWSAQAEVLTGEMTTANERRDRNMWAMLSSRKHPRLSGAIRNAARPGAAGQNATLSLRIRDQELECPVTITDWTETAEGVRFNAGWKVSLKKFGIKPPSVLGVVRVGDVVYLEAQVTAIDTAKAGSEKGGAAVPSNP